MSLLRYPYTNLHELNLDWIIEQLNKEGAVLSVNDKHGIVTLTGEDINRSSNSSETVAAALTSQGQSIQSVRTQIGVTPLPTTAQTLTGAIAENAQEIADIEDNVIGDTELPTEAQTLTGAIAENAQDISTNAENIQENAEDISSINTKIGTTALPTTAQTLTGAIAEHEQDINSINTKVDGLTVRYVTWDYSIDANISANTNLKTLIDGNMPAGKRFLGIVGYTTNNANVVPTSMRYEETNYSWQLRNVSNSLQEAKAYCYYLCI